MRRFLFPLLLAADLFLGTVLAWQWLTPRGEWRAIWWSAPVPIKPVLSDPVLPGWNADLANFVAALDRPLFSASRRPPPVAKPDAAPVVDPLADIRVLGLYTSGVGGGGAIVRTEGVVRRLKHGDSLGAWTVKEIVPAGLVLARGSEQRTVEIKRGPDIALDVPGQGVSTNSSSAAVATQRQDVMQQQEETRRLVNAQRARSGRPPLPP